MLSRPQQKTNPEKDSFRSKASMKMKSNSVCKRLRNLRLSPKTPMYRISLLTHSPHPSGRTLMSRRVSFASSSVVSPKSSPRVAVDASEVRSTSYCVVILRPPNLSCSSMSTKLRQEVSTRLARAAQPSV